MTELRYIELKTGYHDNGPAWIGKVKLSKSGRTVYFNGRAFRKENGAQGNYYDAETFEEYWISGVKKDGTDRHWAGGGKVEIDRAIIPEYLKITGQNKLDDRRFSIVDIPEDYPVRELFELENEVGK